MALKLVEYKTLDTALKKGVSDLWNKEYPVGLVYENTTAFNTYLKTLSNPFHALLFDDEGTLRGWHFDFMREHKKWFALIVDAGFQRMGYGCSMLQFAKEKESELNGWVIDHSGEKKKDGSPYLSPLEFYIKNGFTKSEERLELDHISAVKIKWRRDTI